MANLLGANIGTNYKGFLNIGTTINTPLDSTLRPITDGMGNQSPLQLSSNIVGITANLGIGSTNPTHKLEVVGNIKIGLGDGSVERLWTSGGPTISYDPIASVFEFGGGYINVDTANGIVNMQYSPVVIGAALSHPSAKLEVASTNQGILFPRMTTTQKNAISSPAAGLVIYDTTLGKLCVRGASAWQTITSV